MTTLKGGILSTLLFSVALPALAANYPTGLKPITAKELRHMQKNLGLRRIKEVKPTALGLSRINEHRSAKGLTTLSTTLVKAHGKDTTLDARTDYEFETSATSPDNSGDILAGALPTAIDNSTLAAFPPIRWQTWNNCTAWAMGYYQHTHNNGIALGWSNNNTDNTKKCSPKFIYNMINNGVDQGSYFSDGLNMLSKHGCVSWSNFPEDMDYKAWDLNPDHWQAALTTRSQPFQYVYNVDTQTGLDQMKQLLLNGYVLTYGTYINSWQYSTIKSGTLAGKQVMTWVNGTNGSHAMTVVGYDDNQWVDINGNNVQEAGEMGVLKIANSWGTGWGLAGYMYVAYDALKSVSAVGGPSSGRQPGFQSRMVYHQPVKASGGIAYRPKFLAKFTLHHAHRNQLSLKLGWSDPLYASATSTWTPFAIMNKGGALAFNGTTTPVSGTFVMDASELPITTTGFNKLYLTVTDSSSGSQATLSNFQLIDVDAGTSATASGTPLYADASSATASLNYARSTANATPVASMSVSVSSGTAPLAINFDGGASSDSDGTIMSYYWTFGDGTTASGAYVSKTYNSAGTFTATLKVTDDDGATASTTKTITVNALSTVDTTAPTVTLTAPVNGARYARYSTVTATATASDNKGVTKVRFYAGGKLKCTDYSAPYSCSFSMPLSSSLSVKARAYDAAGNYRTSTIIYIKN